MYWQSWRTCFLPTEGPVSTLMIKILIIGLVLLAPAPQQDAWAIPLYAWIVATWGMTGAFVATRKAETGSGG